MVPYLIIQSIFSLIMSFPYLHKTFHELLSHSELKPTSSQWRTHSPPPPVGSHVLIPFSHFPLTNSRLLDILKSARHALASGPLHCWSLCWEGFPLTYPHGLLLHHLGSFLKFSARPSLTSSGKTAAFINPPPAILSLGFIFLRSTYHNWTYYVCDWLVDLPPLRTWAPWGKGLLSGLSQLLRMVDNK